jgi:hypothetical protein
MGITLTKNFLFGIYYKESNGPKNGIFKMSLSNKSFSTITLDFNPVYIANPFFTTPGETDELVIIIDDHYKIYNCSMDLTVTPLGDLLPSDLLPTSFMTFGMTAGKDTAYFSSDDKVIDIQTLTPLPIQIDGKILSIQYYLNYLFIIYISDYNQYSIHQYDFSTSKVIKTIEGGMVTGPPIFSTIFRHNLMISASKNKVIPMSQFVGMTPPPQVNPIEPVASDPYQLFDLFEYTPTYIDENILSNIEKVKIKNETLEVDTQSVETENKNFYLWLLFAFLIIGMFVLLMANPQVRWVQSVSIFILVSSIVFIIISYI